MNQFKKMCMDDTGKINILQGNIAFALGCVRAGSHSVDGYTGTPSTEVIDKGLSNVKDLIDVNWSVNEAVSAGVSHGHKFIQSACLEKRLNVKGKNVNSSITEWSPEAIAIFLEGSVNRHDTTAEPIRRSPLIYAECPCPVFRSGHARCLKCA